jgi:hypothetical protein
MYRLLLAVPFLVGIAVLQGLTVEIDTFHGSDARVYQLPTIELLRERLDFSDYPSAQTPLFHLVMVAWGKLVGFELWKLRLLNVAISYGAALALLHLLRRATGLRALPTFALTLAFVLSPYFFGASFTLLTDNLAILFALLALERLLAFSRSGAAGAFATACLWIGAAVLTRQSFLWLVAVAAFFVLRRPAPLARRAGLAAVLGLALLPLAALVIEWNGLVPPGADPASCGLCTDRPGFGRDTLTLRTLGFTLALLGLYATVVLGPSTARQLRLLRGRGERSARSARDSAVGQTVAAHLTGGHRRPLLPGRRALTLAAVAGVALLLISPLEYTPVVPGRPGDAGWLWRVSNELPTVLGSSLLYWGLVPLGAALGALLVHRAGWAALASVYLGAFLVATLPVGLVYQKYFDPFMLLAVALFARPADLRTRLDYGGIALICVASVAYALSFAA